MTTPEVVKLTAPGSAITVAVSASGPVPVGQYPEIAFTGTASDRRHVTVQVPKSSADRQLGRLDLTYATAVGKVLTFSRDPNTTDPRKPYWGITLADAPEFGRPIPGLDDAPTPEAPHPADAENGDEERRAALYPKITDYVLDKIVPRYEAKGIAVTMEGVGAIVATLYIQACKR